MKEFEMKNSGIKKHALNLLRAALLALALAFICIGLARGEADAVLRKAMRVCLECIGVG